MRFVSIYLLNYIGIYNGMNLYEMSIDFTRCRNRITIIRGDNGSGKSTLMKALSLFPDSNDSFIPGKPAKKEIVLQDNMTFYKLSFIHGIKSNGERDITKAYITKTFGDQIIELNENGNVTSFKDILYTELNLDSNFAALSQLSNNDRGLADKKPAERKKFVNSIISSLDVYNNIYKVLTRKSNSYKSMINSIMAKLNILGDEQVLNSNLESLENRINSIQDNKDKAVSIMAQNQSRISLLDPDNSIQNTNNSLTLEIDSLNKKKLYLQDIIQTSASSCNLNIKDPLNERKSLIDKKNSLIVQNQIDKSTIETLMIQKEAKLVELDKKLCKISSLNNDKNYDTILAEIDACNKTLAEIREIMKHAGVRDMSSINKEEYILALEIVKDIVQYISIFKSEVSIDMLNLFVDYYIENGDIHPAKKVDILISDQADTKDLLEILSQKKNVLESKMHLLNTLNLRPKKCKDDTCPFIKDAMDFYNTNPKEELDYTIYQISEYTKDLEVIENLIARDMQFNEALNKFSIMVREIKKNSIILSKLTNGEIFSDVRVFLSNLINGYDFEYFNSIYQYIELGNQFDIYKSTKSLLDAYIEDQKEYERKSEMIMSINSDIDMINKDLSELVSRIDPINNKTLEREKMIIRLTELESIYDNIIENYNQISEIDVSIADLTNLLSANKYKMTDIEMSLVRIDEQRSIITSCNKSLEPLMKERDKLVHSIEMLKEYKKEKDELVENYNFIDTVKYYSSPTTGIQLVFMELYMGKIISLANELLSYLFQGQYVIQPFIINESEFRIPCLGSGYINDDISSMSSSQIGMISMILSFSLLHNSSTKFNIIKLDEIDGPLDYTNRTSFTDVLDKIMDIMGTEQCIIISHNSELQVDNSDVILLRHDVNNTDFLRGNIIWSF